MTSLNPLHTIERQIGEIIELHGGRGRAVRARVIELLTRGRHPRSRRAGSAPFRISSRAASASA